MKLTLNYHNVPSSRGTHSLVENLIKSLLPSLKIDEAVVRLEQAEEASPAYRTHVHLVTPGPDVFAEAKDHTLLAAINKVVTGLKNKIAHRTQKRNRRTHKESLVSSRHVSAGLGY